MHEWKITEAIIEEISRQAERNGIQRVNKVVLTIGNDSDLTADSIKFCFNALERPTALKDTALDIKKREGKGGVVVESIEGET